MKRSTLLLCIIVLLSALVNVSCSSKTFILKPKGAPPGQVKKATGSQSAKPYAPGQVKKGTSNNSGKSQGKGKKKN
jgi:hypothetical protein